MQNKKSEKILLASVLLVVYVLSAEGQTINQAGNLTVTAYSPENESNTTEPHALLNASVENNGAGNISMWVWGANDSNALGDSLLYLSDEVPDGAFLSYNWTAPVLRPGGSSKLLLHFDNLLERGETDHLARDMSGNSNDVYCTNKCPVFEREGRFGGAFNYTGSLYWRQSNSSTLDIPGSITIAFWAKFNTPGQYDLVLSFTESVVEVNETEEMNDLYEVAVEDGGNIEFNWEHDAGELVFTKTGEGLITKDGRWYHITLVRESSNTSNAYYYVDGVLKEAITELPNPSGGSNSSFFIGYDNKGSRLRGMVDELAIWDRALSQEEVSGLYLLGAGKYYWFVNASDESGINDSGVLEFTVLPPDTPPTATLISPSDGETLTQPDITFNCSASDDYGLVNATLYLGTPELRSTLHFREDGSLLNKTEDSQVIEGAADTNFGSSNTLGVDYTDGDYGNTISRSLIKFPNIFGTGAGQVPYGAEIIDASLTLQASNEGNDILFYLLTANWTEGEVTWNNRTATQEWTAPGLLGDVDESYFVEGIASPVGSYDYNVTVFLQNWSHGLPNYGFLIKETGSNGADFVSSEGLEYLRPLLAVTYIKSPTESLKSNQTKPLPGLNSSVSFSVDFLDEKAYMWNCEVFDSDGNSAFAQSDFVFTVNTSFLPPPNAPQLVSPLNGSTGVSTSPLLNVSVSEPDGGLMNVTFFGRNSSGENFTIVVLPDTQFYSQDYPDIFTNQTEWIAANAESMNIRFVIHEGDLVQTWDAVTQWENANASLTVLDDNSIPYSVVPGNHDHEGGSTLGSTSYYNTYLPVSRFSSNGWWGGNFSGNDNNFHLMTIGGQDYIFLSLDYCPSADELGWANDTLSAYPDRKAFLTTHGFLDGSASRTVHGCGSTEYIWSDLIRHHANLQIVLCGHVHAESRRADTNLAGNPVHQILADYQSEAMGGNGFLRIMTFSPQENKIFVETYSPYLDQYDTDSDSGFTLDYPVTDFEEIGRDTGVASGSHAAVTWPNLSPKAAYSWYANVSDNTSQSTASPIWSFTTASGSSESSENIMTGWNLISLPLIT